VTQTVHVKVAVTSNNLNDVDADFANTRQILIYDVRSTGSTFLDVIQFDGRPGEVRGPGGGKGCSGDDPLDGGSAEGLEARIKSLAGCGILFTLRLTDFAAVPIFNGGTFPVKLERRREVATVLNRLQSLIRANTPGWLRRKLVPEEAQGSPLPAVG